MRTVEIWIRSFFFNITLFVLLGILPVLFVWILLLPFDKLTTVMGWWGKLFALAEKHIAGIDFRVIGAENIPEGACIIAAKHQSAWETCKLHLLFKDPAVVLKKELTQVPIWGWFAVGTRMIPIDRKGGIKSLAVMMKAARDAAAAGRKIVIFPQGTRLKPGVRKPYKVGVAGLYQEMDLPLVPMALNSGLFWPKEGFLKKPGLITVEFLPPIPPGLTRTEMMRRLEKSLETASDRLAGISA